MDTNDHEWAKSGVNHEKHETHETPWFGHILNHEWTRMDTNGQKQGLTTKHTKGTKKRRGESRNHEWTRMAGGNHERHEMA